MTLYTGKIFVIPIQFECSLTFLQDEHGIQKVYPVISEQIQVAQRLKKLN